MATFARESIERLQIPAVPQGILGPFLILLSIYLYRLFSKNEPKLPPSPPKLPIIGNLHQMPLKNRWRTFREWHKTYGPIMSIKIGQRDFITIGSHKVAADLLRRRGDIYSSRPKMVVAGDCISKGLHSVLLPYGDQWRAHHRILVDILSNRRCHNYLPIQDIESRQMLHGLLHDPDDFTGQFKRFAASLMYVLAYGKRIEEPDQNEVTELVEITDNILEAVNKTASKLVEAFPVLNNLPRVLAPWKRMGDEYHSRTVKVFSDKLEEGKARVPWNWTKHALKINEHPKLKALWDMSEKEVAYILGVLQEGGGETTSATLEIFTLACVVTPEAVRNAHEEIDRVVGNTRLPSFDDMEKLPYVNALIKEVHRWRPLVPLGLPHSPIRDDEYMGYRIPKGALVLPNNWTLELDEEIFKDPTVFRPGRWIENPDLPSAAFGYGRRLCPGRYFAQRSMFITVSRILWAYGITHAYENGKKIEVDEWNMKQNASSPPAPFKAAFHIRSEEHRRIIEAEWSAAEKDFTKFLDHAGATA